MDFDIKDFLKKSVQKIGPIKKIDLDYWQFDDFRVKLVISAFNEAVAAKFDDYYCEPVAEFYFGENFTSEKYLETKLYAKEIRAYLKKNHPEIEVYRSTKCNLVWFGK